MPGTFADLPGMMGSLLGAMISPLQAVASDSLSTVTLIRTDRFTVIHPSRTSQFPGGITCDL